MDVAQVVNGLKGPDKRHSQLQRSLHAELRLAGFKMRREARIQELHDNVGTIILSTSTNQSANVWRAL